ncbi:MAG: hypothetical protein Kow002_10500 [Anaerolineales bacterium]
MKRFDPRMVIGSLLILGGGLMLLERFGFLEDAGDLFWGAVFLIAGIAFLTLVSSGGWWGFFPGFVLAGIGVLILLPESLDDLGGVIFLGFIGLAFWAAYLTDRSHRWWAIIPAGVMTTLAAVALVSEFLDNGFASGGVFFFGLALTFLLVAFLAGMGWAYWPAGALAVMGLFLFAPAQLGLMSYLGAFALIAAGGFLIWRFFRPE